MGINDDGPDPSLDDHLLTLGAGDGRYTLKSGLVSVQSDIASLRKQFFGDEQGTMIPCCIVEPTADYSVSANQDTFAKVMWRAVYDPFGMFSSAGQVGGYSGYASVTVPFDGRYLADLSVVSSQRSGTGALKILARTGNGAPVVDGDSISSTYQLPSGSEFPMHTFTSEGMIGGLNLYWSTFHSVAGAVNVSSFGGVRSRFTLFWMGTG